MSETTLIFLILRLKFSLYISMRRENKYFRVYRISNDLDKQDNNPHFPKVDFGGF